MINLDKNKTEFLKRVLIDLLKQFGKIYIFSEFLEKYPENKELVLLLIFILKGIGFVVFINNKKFQYTGRINTILKFIENLKQKIKKIHDLDDEAEEEKKNEKGNLFKSLPLDFAFDFKNIEINQKETNILVFNHISNFAEKIIFTILLDQNKTLNKGEIKKFLNKNINLFKEEKDKQLFTECLNILVILNLLEISDSSPMITWKGPDFINCLGVCNEDFNYIKSLKQSIDHSLYEYIKNYNGELFNREILYYKQLLSNELNEKDLEIICKNFFDFENKYAFNDKFLKSILPNLNIGYAILKGKNKNYIIKKLSNVIGRKNKNSKLNVRWQVDINLGNNKKISKQHCLIFFNFLTQKFEIKCLSEKYPCKINNKKLYNNEKPVILGNGTLISIGDQHFYFILPK